MTQLLVRDGGQRTHRSVTQEALQIMPSSEQPGSPHDIVSPRQASYSTL